MVARIHTPSAYLLMLLKCSLVHVSFGRPCSSTLNLGLSSSVGPLPLPSPPHCILPSDFIDTIFMIAIYSSLANIRVQLRASNQRVKLDMYGAYGAQSQDVPL